MTAIDEVLEQEQLARAKRELDLEAIERIYADDLLLTGVLGEPTCSKNAVMDEIRRGIAQRDGAKTGGVSFETSTANEDMKVVTLGDTAVANYRFVLTVKLLKSYGTGSRDTGRDLVENAGENWTVYSSLVKVLRVSRTGCPGTAFVISTNVLPPSSILISRILSTGMPSLLTTWR